MSSTEEVSVSIVFKPRTCKLCGGPVGPRSKTGYCKKCWDKWGLKKRPSAKVLERRQKMLDHIRKGTPFTKIVEELSHEYHVHKFTIAKDYIELFELAP